MEMGESEVLWNRSDRFMDDPIGSWDDHGNGVAGIILGIHMSNNFCSI